MSLMIARSICLEINDPLTLREALTMLHRSITLALLTMVACSRCLLADEPADLPPLEIKLLKAGKPPLRALRYRIKPGSSEKLVMGMKTAIATEVGDQKQPALQVPTMEMEMRIDIKDVSKDKIEYEFELTGSKLLDDEKVPEPVRKAMSDAATQMVGTTAQASITDRGRPLATKINLPATAAPQVTQLMKSMERSFQNVGAPLPAEEVGLGAQWEVTMAMEGGGIRIKQTANYTLKQLLDDGFVADISLKQTADKQEMKVPNLPPGTTIELQQLTGEGSGTSETSLNQLIPSSKLTLSNTFEAIISSGGKMQPMKSTNTVSITVRRQ
jgi:hypothetical protein